MIWDELDSELAGLAAQGLQRRRRVLDTPCGVEVEVDGCALLSFCSNDYLGLAAEPGLIEAAREAAMLWGVGSGASHLVSGHLEPHETLEQHLAAFVGSARALYFSTGYMANLGVVPALVGRGDAVFADRLNHASLIDAAQLSRAGHHRYPHNDLAALERLLSASTAKRKLILTDAVFSMDGDLAPLPQLLALAERFDAWLVIDDAHGFGVLGPQGRGTPAHLGIELASHPRLLYIGTLGKAAGVSGAFVAGTANVIEWLMQRARTYIFTTAASPIVAATLIKSIKLIEQGDALRSHLQLLIERLRNGLQDTRWQLLASPTAIQPIIIGDNDAALHAAAALAEQGIWVPAIRPPTVPKGTARLRITLSAAHSVAQVDRLLAALKQLQ
ncbi:8-amino-7-oxononanoate synthase [Herminiimonas sp. CN]|uniref:8-amino-7-oxononanoate synthase n=1 Tax=Herminiimonas sp. CN TaxID=1349818 RepID=UPI000473EB11|nr:8-amino-7-oxononanoate synthase [Herminiimonas sp. CN]